jgi:hypothetical protein
MHGMYRPNMCSLRLAGVGNGESYVYVFGTGMIIHSCTYILLPAQLYSEAEVRSLGVTAYHSHDSTRRG